jgi:hypothetical protein
MDRDERTQETLIADFDILIRGDRYIAVYEDTSTDANLSLAEEMESLTEATSSTDSDLSLGLEVPFTPSPNPNQSLHMQSPAMPIA